MGFGTKIGKKSRFYDQFRGIWTVLHAILGSKKAILGLFFIKFPEDSGQPSKKSLKNDQKSSKIDKKSLFFSQKIAKKCYFFAKNRYFDFKIPRNLLIILETLQNLSKFHDFLIKKWWFFSCFLMIFCCFLHFVDPTRRQKWKNSAKNGKK